MSKNQNNPLSLSHTCTNTILKCMYYKSYNDIVLKFTRDFNKKPQLKLCKTKNGCWFYQLKPSKFEPFTYYFLKTIFAILKIEDLPIPLFLKSYVYNLFLDNINLKFNIFQVSGLFINLELSYRRLLCALSCLY